MTSAAPMTHLQKLRYDYHRDLLHKMNSSQLNGSLSDLSSKGIPDEVLHMGMSGLHYSDMLTQRYFGTNDPPDLPSYIHPIFCYDQKRWRNLPMWKYQRLNLGLRLASQLLVSPPCIHFWAKAIFGTFETNAEGKKYLDDIQITPDIAEHTRQIMDATAPYIEFGFTDPENLEKPAAFAETSYNHARTWTVPTNEWCFHYRNVQGLPMLILVNQDLVAAFEPQTDQDVELRMQFMVASTLLHELAHVIYALVRVPVVNYPELGDENAFPFGVDDEDEVWFQEHSPLESSEWGFELELALFGCLVFPTGLGDVEKVPYFGLWCESFSGDRFDDDQKADDFIRLVPMSWVTWWFRTDSIRNYNRKRLSALPELTMFWYSVDQRKIVVRIPSRR